MASFSARKIKGETFGEILAQARRAQGLRLSDVARRLKIKLNYLKALETEDLKSLPPPVYVQGFLEHYARFLKLDASIVLRHYKTERNILDNLHYAEKLVYQSKLKRFSLLNISPKIVKLGLIAFCVIAFLMYLGWELSGFSAPPVLKIIAPADNEQINTDTLAISGESDPEAAIFVNGQQVFVDREGNFQEQIVLAEGLNIIEILARNKLGRERKVAKNVLVRLPDDFIRAAPVVAGESEISSQELALIVKIKNNATWVSVDTDGANAFQGTMLPETFQEFKGRDKITITSGRASNTYIIFNGQDFGNLGGEGEVARNVEFTRDLKIDKK